MQPKLAVSREGATLRLAFNRPGKKNAIDREMYLQLIDQLASAQVDESLCVVVFAGAGGVFSAGNDLQDFRSVLLANEEFPALRFVRALALFEKPIVAAVAGDAVGIGATLLFHCDLVYAAPSASFRFPFVDLGLVPEAGSSLLAPQRFGHAKAAQYLLACERFGAEEALRLGLVNEIVEEPRLLDVALAAAQRLAQKPKEALLATRRLLRGDIDALVQRIDEEAALFSEALQSPQVKARLAAFFEKTPR